MDADQFPERNLLHFARYFSPSCIVAIDDYFVEDGSAKGQFVHAFVDRLVAAGALREAGSLHCTWFGRVDGAAGLARLAALRQPRFAPDQGFGWVADPESLGDGRLPAAAGRHPRRPNRLQLDPAIRARLETAMLATAPDGPRVIVASPLVILEDGVPLARPHALHDEIRRLGQGRYSHWTYRGGARPQRRDLSRSAVLDLRQFRSEYQRPALLSARR